MWLVFVFITSLGTVHSHPIKAIIFDCDGTLIDNGVAYFLDWQHALRCQGYELDEGKFWKFMHKNKLVGAPQADETLVQYCCALLGRDCADHILKDKKAFSAHLHKTYPFPPIESTVNFLHALAKVKDTLRIKLGLASGSNREHVLRVLKRLQIESYFDVVVTADDLTDYTDIEGVNKPKPYIYMHAAKLLGIPPEECVAIEDSRTGITSAVSAGCFAVAIPNTYTAQQDLSHAHLKILSLAGITPTHFLQLITTH